MPQQITWRNVNTGSQTGILNAVGDAGKSISGGINKISSTIGGIAKNEQADEQRVRDENKQKLLNNISSLDQAGLDAAGVSGEFGLDSLRAQGFNANEVGNITGSFKSQAKAVQDKQRSDSAYSYNQGQQQRTLDEQARGDSERIAGNTLSSLVMSNRFDDYKENPQAFLESLQQDPAWQNATPDKQLQIQESAMKQFEDVRKMVPAQRTEHAALSQTAQQNVTALTQNHQQKLSVLATNNNVGQYSGNVEDAGVQATMADINSRDDGMGLEIYGRVTEALGFAPNGEVFRDIIAKGRNNESWYKFDSTALDESIKGFREGNQDSNLNKYLREKSDLDNTFNANVKAANAVPASFVSNARQANRTKQPQAQGSTFNLMSRLVPDAVEDTTKLDEIDTNGSENIKVIADNLSTKREKINTALHNNPMSVSANLAKTGNNINQFAKNVSSAFANSATTNPTIKTVDSYGLKGSYNSGDKQAKSDVLSELIRREKVGELDKDSAKFLAGLRRENTTAAARKLQNSLINPDVPR